MRVSCLCVTRGRPELLSRSIDCFARQTWPSRELVVVYERDDRDTLEYLRSRPDVRWRSADARPGGDIDPGVIVAVGVDAAPKQPLGTLRNLAAQAAAGDYLCQWDDDDWYHPLRLEAQMEPLLRLRAQACLLARWTLFDAERRRAYCSYPRLDGWEGSLLCARAAQPTYPPLARAEDSPAVRAVRARVQVALVADPSLYVYTFHGGNTWDRSHFDRLCAQSTPLGEARREELCRTLALVGLRS